MKILAILALTLALLSGCSGGGSETKLGSVDYAYMICRVADSTNVQSEPCNVNVPNIDLHLAMSPSDARATCSAIAGVARQKGWAFESFWQVRVFSPYASGGPIATCSLG